MVRSRGKPEGQLLADAVGAAAIGLNGGQPAGHIADADLEVFVADEPVFGEGHLGRLGRGRLLGAREKQEAAARDFDHQSRVRLLVLYGDDRSARFRQGCVFGPLNDGPAGKAERVDEETPVGRFLAGAGEQPGQLGRGGLVLQCGESGVKLLQGFGVRNRVVRFEQFLEGADRIGVDAPARKQVHQPLRPRGGVEVMLQFPVAGVAGDRVAFLTGDRLDQKRRQVVSGAELRQPPMSVRLFEEVAEGDELAKGRCIPGGATGGRPARACGPVASAQAPVLRCGRSPSTRTCGRGTAGSWRRCRRPAGCG